MAMRNTDRDFYGRQEGEKILYVVHPHALATLIGLVKVFGISLIVSLVLIILGTQLGSAGSLLVILGILFFFIIIILGSQIVLNWQRREIAYITDRRLVRFEPTTLVATNSRTLSWDDVVKVKTFPPNFIFKQLAIGNVVVHARTPARPYDDQETTRWMTADDIQLNNVYYYRDLGNYIDKILFTYKQRPREVSEFRPFVPKPKGQRY